MADEPACAAVLLEAVALAEPDVRAAPVADAEADGEGDAEGLLADVDVAEGEGLGAAEGDSDSAGSEGVWEASTGWATLGSMRGHSANPATSTSINTAVIAAKAFG